MKKDNVLYFDIESTGLELHKVKIITMSFIFNGEKKTVICNPGMPIPLEASKVHGIYDKDVKDAKPFAFYSEAIFKLCNMAETYAGYNIRKYDIVLLKMEMLRCGYEIPDLPIIDVYELANELFRSLKLKDIYLTLSGEKFEAHNSADDILATKKLHEIILDKYLRINK